MATEKFRRGSVTKSAIIQAAAELMHIQGVSGTSVDEVLSRSGTGKSQFYQHFASKTELVHAVVAYQLTQIIQDQRSFLDRLTNFEIISQWLDHIATLHDARALIGGCPLGSLAAEMADRDEPLRRELALAFGRWESFLARGLQQMKAKGNLRPDADPRLLAGATIAAIEGGYLLSTAKRDIAYMHLAVDTALVYLRSFENRDND